MRRALQRWVGLGGSGACYSYRVCSELEIWPGRSPVAACLSLELVIDDSSLHASGSNDEKLYRKEPYA